MTSWSDIFHVGFVVAFGIRALVVSYNMAMRWSKPKSNERGRGATQVVKAMMIFLFAASCWMILLPIFTDCGSEANNDTSKFCFFFKVSDAKQAFTVSAPFIKMFVSQRVNLVAVTAPRYSILDLVAREWYKRLTDIINYQIKERIMRLLLIRAIYSPFTFHQQLKTLFMVIRWAKFAGPLVGTCNKFRGHLLDMVKKRRQHFISKAAQQRWGDLLDAYAQRSKLERAALTSQRQFRERRAAKARRRFTLMTTPRNTSNRQLARHIRTRLVEEQLLSRSKLKKMDLIDSQRKLRRQVSNIDRMDIADHKESVRKLKKKLLLSPKTSFAVGWKYVTIACVALEISQIAFAPVLAGELKKMPLDKFLLKVLNASSLQFYGDKIVVAAPSIFIPAINNFGDITCATSSLRQAWLVISHIIATGLVTIVKVVFFLDVFVTFFTGELTSSGTLVPKPFFMRYILPGIGLQLIVNPTMIEISRLVKQTVIHAVHVGPSLCFHLIIACVPFVASCYDCVLDIIFDFVERQNKIVMKR